MYKELITRIKDTQLMLNWFLNDAEGDDFTIESFKIYESKNIINKEINKIINLLIESKEN